MLEQSAIWLPPLLRVYAQTAALSILFACAGAVVLRSVGPRQDGAAESAAGMCGRAYFIGLSCFLALFLFFSRLLGSARWGLAVALVALIAIAVAGRFRRRGTRIRGRDLARTGAAFGLLVVFFSVTNLACWLDWNSAGPSYTPDSWSHFGSIHAGRYANYSILIAEQDRIGYWAQNMGQSMLGAYHLLLGVRAPLAALIAWVPHSLAALTLLVFGALRTRGLSRFASVAGSCFVLLCNIALAWRHVLVLDNGSPLGLIGYTDFILAIGTFLVFAAWLERITDSSFPRAALLLPGLLGLTWCWHAPQNVVLAVPAGAAVLWARRSALRRQRRVLLSLVIAAAVFAVGVVVGAMQLGTFLPPAAQEELPTASVLPASGVTLRPYLLYVTSHWSDLRWSIEIPGQDVVHAPRVYEPLWQAKAGQGRAAFAAAAAGFALRQFATSLRIYFFPLAGLLLLGLTAARLREKGAPAGHGAVRFWIALATFGTGYAIVFLCEYGGMKWWLTRFLGPGAAVSLLWGFSDCAGFVARFSTGVQRTLLLALLIVACYGPLAELSWVFRENFIRTRGIDPLGHRLALLVNTPGPYR